MQLYNQPVFVTTAQDLSRRNVVKEGLDHEAVAAGPLSKALNPQLYK